MKIYDKIFGLTDDDLKEYAQSLFNGLTLSKAGMVLDFQPESRGNFKPYIQFYCPFECEVAGCIESGHGEISETAIFLFPFLGHKIKSCSIQKDEILSLSFCNGDFIRILPDGGVEPYIITTSAGISPFIG